MIPKFNLGSPNILERLRKFLNFRNIIYSAEVVPVVKLNDELTDQVNCFNVTRTSTGTSAITTTPSGRSDTYVTAIVLSFSATQEGV